MREINRDEMRERIGNLELIRDLIFGPKLQEYDGRINNLESHLSSLENELRDRTLAIKSDYLTELQTSVNALEEKIKSLSFTSQRENADLRQLVDGTYKSFTSSLDSIDKTLTTQTNAIRKELSETREKLQEDTQSLKSQVFEELEKRFALLTDAKLARNDIADILFEVGIRIKKAEFTPELKEATRTNGSDEALLIEASKVSE